MRKLLIANWKMYYGPIKAGSWIRAFRRERLPKELDIAVAVPFVSLAAARASLGRASLPVLAAQDVFWNEEGAYTGEISPSMLKEFGVQFCLVGHSERRQHLGETDEMVAKKARALQKVGITPVICVGETLAQHRRGESAKTIRAQVVSAIEHLVWDGKAIPVIAYEPIWAIGTGKPCATQEVREVHEMIRATIAKKEPKFAEHVRIIYGGSVDLRTVGDYLTTTEIDGCLIGGASLDPRQFGLLSRAAVSS